MSLRVRSVLPGWPLMNRNTLRFAAMLACAVAGCPAETPEAGSNAAAVGGIPPASPAPDSLKRIMILINGDSPFWDACRVGVKDAQRDFKLEESGFRAVVAENDGTPQGQLEKLRQFANQVDIAAIGVSAIDANNVAIADEMRKLQQHGVKVVTIDSDLDRDKLRDARFAFIGTDNQLGGRELGICAKNIRPGGGGYVTFVGRTGAQNAIERVGGFADGAGEKFVSLDNMGDDTDRTRARDNVRNAIRNQGDKLNTLVGIWSYNAPAIVDVVQELQVRDKTTVVVFDAEPLAITHMEGGQIDAMIVQNPYQMGYQGVRLMKALIDDDQPVVRKMFPTLGEPDGDLYDTGLKVVVPADDSPLKPDMFGKKTEFLTLETFKQWLNKYDLKGS